MRSRVRNQPPPSLIESVWYAHASRCLLPNVQKILLSSMSGKGFMQSDPRLSYSSRRSTLMLGVRTHRFPLRSVTAWLLRGVRPLVYGPIIFARSNAWLTWVELLPLAMAGSPFFPSGPTPGFFFFRVGGRFSASSVLLPLAMAGPLFYHSVSTVGLFALRVDARLCAICVLPLFPRRLFSLA